MKPWVSRMKDAVKIYKSQGWKAEINFHFDYAAVDRYDTDGNRIEDGYFLQGHEFHQLIDECPDFLHEKDWLVFQVENYCMN